MDPERGASPPHTVIVAPNWLGDAVMALPAICDVRRALPQALMAVAARPSVLPLFAMVRQVDRVVDVDNLRSYGFETAILLPNSFRAAAIAFRARIPERWGYRTDGRAPLLTRSVSPPRRVHQAEYYQRLTDALGFPAGDHEPRLDVDLRSREAGAALLADSGWNPTEPFVALAPGAAYGGAKRWPPTYFADLADQLARDGVRSVMVGGAADVQTGAEVEAAVRDRRTLLNLIGRTDLATLAGVLVQARTLVTNDSGAMHVGAAVGIPVTAIFGPTRETETGPPTGDKPAVVRARRSIENDQRSVIGDQPSGLRNVVLTNQVWCRPCMLRECPLDHRCMLGVLPAAVLEAARRAL